MIKALIFDVGGVLHGYNSSAMHTDIQTTLGLSPAQERKAYYPLIHSLVKGKISEKEFWEEFVKISKPHNSFPGESLFLREFRKNYLLYQDVLDMVKALKKLGYILIILSNTIPPHANFNRKQGCYDGFDYCFLSNEIGMHKPDEEIYIFTLGKLDVKPDEIIFIDDNENNIAGAQKVGMYTIKFENAVQLEQQLNTFGVQI